MQITFKTYKRRDGQIMLYINRSNRVSVGLSEDRSWAAYGKGVTAGQRNAVAAARAVIRAHGEDFTGDLENHKKAGNPEPIDCGGVVTLAITEIAEVGGMSVRSDGAYVIMDGKIVRCGVPYNEVLD